MDLLVPDTVDNRYKVIDVIGTGAMATVYSAEDTRLGRKVAVKILRPEQAQDSTFRARFKREAEAVASLNYPAIVAVYDTGNYSPSESYGTDSAQEASSEATLPYIVMELLTGRTLREVLSSGGHLPLRETAGYARQLLGALQYSHDKGIVHRDIKPANIMVLPVTEEDIAKGQPGQIKVMDFGISRALEEAGEALTKANVVMGSARYMSPEQVKGEEVDTRSDLYSAACVIYEMIAGRPPFVADSNVDLAAMHLSDTPAAPSSFTPLEIPAAVDAVLLTALSKDPAQRYQSADEFAAALAEAISPSTAVPVDEAMTTAYTVPAAVVAASGAGDYSPYTSSLDSTSDVEDGDLGNFFDPDEEEYEDEEEYYEEEPRKSVWGRFLMVSAIVLLALGLVGSVLYYQSKLNEVPQVQVPTISNVSKDDADTQLRNLGFQLEYKEAFSDTVKKGNVLSVDPASGTKMDKGSKITVTLSKGPQSVKLPTEDEVRGQSEAYVRNLLKEAGLVDGRVSTVDSVDVQAGMVVGLSPDSGEVEAGSTVDIILSSGKVKVPSVVGKTQDAATEALKNAQLHVNIKYVTTSNNPAGTVVSQSLAADTPAEQHTTVTIEVAKAPEPSASPSSAAPAPTARATTAPTQAPAATARATAAPSSSAPSTPAANNPAAGNANPPAGNNGNNGNGTSSISRN